MLEVFRKLVGVVGWFAGLVREVDRGIVVGRGYEPVVENTQKVRYTPQVHRGADCGRRVARRETRARRGGK